MAGSFNHRPRIIVVCGPTACGKSEVALELALRFKGEIINADSVQIYKDFNIGAAKPPECALATVPHHLYSFVSPEDHFDVGIYCRLARQKIVEVVGRGALPVVVGGTGLYICSLLNGLLFSPDDQSLACNRLNKLEEELSLQGFIGKDLSTRLHNYLKLVDPESASVINRADLPRIRRALIFWFSAGTSLRQEQIRHAHQEQELSALVLCILPERLAMYEAINKRVEKMVDLGLVEEVRDLRCKYSLKSRPFGAIGYSDACQLLDGKVLHSEMLELIQRKTRRFAKRQVTWWRNQPKSLGWRCLPRENLSRFETIPALVFGLIEDFISKRLDFEDEGIFYLPLENIEVPLL